MPEVTRVDFKQGQESYRRSWPVVSRMFRSNILRSINHWNMNGVGSHLANSDQSSIVATGCRGPVWSQATALMGASTPGRRLNRCSLGV